MAQRNLQRFVVRPGNRTPGVQRTVLRRIVGILTTGGEIALVGIIEIGNTVVVQIVKRQGIVEARAAEHVKGENNRVGGGHYVGIPLRVGAGATAERVCPAWNEGLNLVLPELLQDRKSVV